MVMNTLGGRIEQARRARGLTMRQLAQNIGVKASTLDNWERDRSEPRSNKLMMLSGVLNVPVTWLLTEDGVFEHEQTAPCTSDAIMRKLERATALQQDLSALLSEISADVRRQQSDLDAEVSAAA